MSKGRLTIPTDSTYVEGTKTMMEKWGADAVRDCDGTELPTDLKQFNAKVYKTYFLSRGNNDFAYAHDEYLQNVALISNFKTATCKTLEIDPLEDYYDEQLKINEDKDSVCLWQVIDRTTGKEISDWTYDKVKKVVVINNAEYMHEYTVSFFAKSLWDATQIYNYKCNGWTVTKDRDIDPVFPEAVEVMKADLEKWLIENPDINVIRFTTFFYHFFLIHKKGYKGQRYFEWFGYATTASPTMFKLFEQQYGYKITIEDVVDEGYYINPFRQPDKTTNDYLDFVQKFVSEKVRIFTDICHKYGREAMMFLGDNWIGAEIYGKYFKDMKLDAVVGSVNSGATLRMLSDIEGVNYREARFLPYFFPDTLADEQEDITYLNNNWVIERRAVLRKPVDRIGFGGYLKLAARFPKFVDAVSNLADEFRTIYDNVANKKIYSSLKIAILNSWGHLRSWMVQMVCQDAPYQKIQNYQGILESLAGLPVDVDFINFDDVLNGKLQNYDVVLNYGDEGTAFSGGEVWKNGEITAKIKEYVYNGGGFIGIGEPSAVQFNGKFFQLASVLGVDEEKGFSLFEPFYNYKKADSHFITADVTGEIDYGNSLNDIYAYEGTEILDIVPDKYMGLGINVGHVKMAVNSFGKGRSFYATGLKYNYENTRLLYRAMLWCSHKEDLLEKAFSSNVNTECNYYPEINKYALVNNTTKPQNTVFYDINGKKKEISLLKGQLRWFDGEGK